MEIEFKFVHVGKIKTHYLEAGVGDQVVVLVHSRLWSPAAVGHSGII